MENTILENTPQKQCKVCKNLFPETTEFFVRKQSGKNGLDSHCRPCRYAYNKANREKPKVPRAITREGFKFCSKCSQELPATKEFFASHSLTLDKLHPDCKQCQHNKYRASHAPRILVSDAPNGYKRCSECREVFSATLEYFHALSKEKDGLHRICKQCRTTIRTQQRLQRIEAARKHEREIRSLHPEHGYNRRARKLNAHGSFTARDIQQQHERQHGKCYYCKTKFDKKRGRTGYHADHVIPLARTGTSNNSWNIVLTCPTCNLKKGSKLPHEWPEGNRLL